MNISTRSVKLAFIVLFGFAGASAQTLAEYKQRYPDYPEVVLRSHQSYDLAMVKNKLQVLQDNYQETMILNQNGIQNNRESFTYSDLVKIRSYEAFSIVNQGGKERKIKVTQTSDRRNVSNNIFYDDVRERELTFPGLEAGARKVLRYEYEFEDPFLLHRFVFAGAYPVKTATFEVTADKGIDIGYKIFNANGADIKFTTSQKKGRTVYSWTASDVKPLHPEDYHPGFLHVAPHISVYVKSYGPDKEKVQVLDQTNELYTYYKGFVNSIPPADTAELEQLTATLTSGIDNEEDKVRTLFYWVKDNIRYIAFENGYEGFIPRSAGTVFERRFGDCKDMANLIATMAGFAGVENVHLAWIGTRKLPYTYAELSTPATDDHMIAAYRNAEGHFVFLDATDNLTRYGLPTAFIQGKEALIDQGNHYEIVEVPIVSPSDNLRKDEVKLHLQDDILAGSGKLTITGHMRSRYLSALGDHTGRTRQNIMQAILLKGNNKFRLFEHSDAHATDRDAPYLIDYTFDLQNYAVRADDELYVNLFLDKPYDKNIIPAERQAPYVFDFLLSDQAVYTLEIPEKMRIESVPADFTINNDLLDCRFNYKQSPGKISLHLEVNLKKLQIGPQDFNLWNETLRQLKSRYNESIVLKSNL